MADVPGTGTTYTPKAQQPVKLSQGAADAGIQQPEGNTAPRGILIKQIDREVAEAELDELTVEQWIKKHYDAKDFNIQSMAEVLRESTEDIFNRLHAYGYELPDGTYTV